MGRVIAGGTPLELRRSDADRAPVTRRSLLRALALAPLAAGTTTAASCGAGQFGGESFVDVPGDSDLPDHPPLDVVLDQIPDGQRFVVTWGTVPVELRRSGQQVAALALLCTHQGCKLSWRQEAQGYSCPCHEGRFDAQGRPVAGAPTLPLRRVPLRVSATIVRVGGRPRT